MMIKGWISVIQRSSTLKGLEGARCASTVVSTRAEDRLRRSKLFSEEKSRQRAAIGRIEKIEVNYTNWSENVTLLMNQNLSTPYDCAQHISEGMTKMSALAFVDNEPWDMHRPLERECKLNLCTMRMPDERHINRAFWRSCSLILGSVIETAFKDNVKVHLHSFIGPSIKSGSFVYDVQMDLEDWKPTNAELRSLSGLYSKETYANHLFERLVVKPEVALEMFQDNPHKSKQIPAIANDNEGKIILYRIGDFVDISKGPVVSHTGIIGRCTVASVHKIHPDEETGPLYRFQGVALPSGVLLNHFAYGILEDRARKLNDIAWMPQKIQDDSEDDFAIAAKN